MGANKGILQGWLVIVLLALGIIKAGELAIAAASMMIPRAHAASFYPACIKKDGDWLHGVDRKECVGKDVRGQWITNRVLKKARRVM